MKNLAQIAYRLATPWRYYRIKDSTGFLNVINWWIPLALSVVISVSLYFWMDFFEGKTLFILRFKDALCLLPGFFIAALSAVAVFDRKGMDDEMPGGEVTVTLVIYGNPLECEVTRRRFLCMTFAFLAAQSLMLTLILLAFPGRSCQVPPLLNAVSTFGFLLFFIQLVLVALHGLYYLSEKLLNKE